MQHVHYDLDQIEAELRRMFASAPADALSDDPDVAECFRRSVDVMAVSSRFVFSEIMRGTTPEILIKGLECLITNMVVNHLNSFTPADGECVICKFLGNVRGFAHAAQTNRDADHYSDHVVEVRPVTSGHA